MKKEEFIKLGLTEEQAKACETASSDELKGFIPKVRFDEVNESKKQLETDIKTRDTQINDLKKVDGDSLKAEIERLQGENKAAKEKYDSDLNKIKLNNAIEKTLTNSKAKNLKAVKALIDLEKISLDGENIKGLDDQIKALQTDDGSKFLFDNLETDKPNKIKGLKPGEKKDGTPGTINKEQFNKMNYKAKLNLYNENKELYDTLKQE